jgi:hypothetical protein
MDVPFASASKGPLEVITKVQLVREFAKSAMDFGGQVRGARGALTTFR